MTRDNKFTIKLSDVEKQVVEKLSDAYDCSQSAAARMLFSTHYQELFGEIHPEAFDRHDLDIKAVLHGEIDPEEIDDKYRMDSDSTPSVPAADGGIGTSVSPASHTPTQTPTDLAKAGPALSWDELRDAVDRHWSSDEDDEDSHPGFEIHPDRVEPERLKNNRNVCAKILAAIIRSESDAVSLELIEQKVEEYLGHKITRADYERGLEYKIDQYEPLIREHFVSHPNEDDGRQYTTPETRDNEIPNLASITIADLEDKIAAVDFDTWRKTNVEGAEATVADVRNWVEDLADYRESIATLSAITTEEQFRDALMDSNLEHPDEYNDPVHYVSSVTSDRMQSYGSANAFSRYVASNTLLELDDERVVDVDRPQAPVVKFETGESMDEDEQLRTVAEKVA